MAKWDNPGNCHVLELWWLWDIGAVDDSLSLPSATLTSSFPSSPSHPSFPAASSTISSISSISPQPLSSAPSLHRRNLQVNSCVCIS